MYSPLAHNGARKEDHMPTERKKKFALYLLASFLFAPFVMSCMPFESDDDDDDETDDDSIDDDDSISDDDDDDNNDDTFYFEDFESYTPPDLDGTWMTGNRHGVVEVKEVAGEMGQVLHIEDGYAPDDYVWAEDNLSDASGMMEEFSLSFEYIGFSGSLGVQLMDYFYGTRDVANTVVLPVDGMEIWVFDPVIWDVVYCSVVLAPDTWYSIELAVDPILGAGNYSIFVDGLPTTCNSISFASSDFALTGYRFIGFGDDKSGGEGRFDNVTMF